MSGWLLCRYAVGAEEKQSSYTTKQHRDGVCILPFIFAGLFGPLGGSQAAETAAMGDNGDAAEGEHSDGVDEGYEADDDEDVDKVNPGFQVQLGGLPLNVWRHTSP